MSAKPQPKRRTYERGYRDALGSVLAHVRKSIKDGDSAALWGPDLVAWILRADDRYNRRGKKGPGR